MHLINCAGTVFSENLVLKEKRLESFYMISLKPWDNLRIKNCGQLVCNVNISYRVFEFSVYIEKYFKQINQSVVLDNQDTKLQASHRWHTTQIS